MGRGGFPPSETGSFSAHHTAQWVGLFLAISSQLSALSNNFRERIATTEKLRADSLFLLDSL
jgi:hypothetical protein